MDLIGSSIERLSRPTSKETAWDIEFALHCPASNRVLTLKANGDDSFRLWVAAVVHAGGRAPLAADAMGARHRRGTRLVFFLAVGARASAV